MVQEQARRHNPNCVIHQLESSSFSVLYIYTPHGVLTNTLGLLYSRASTYLTSPVTKWRAASLWKRKFFHNQTCFFPVLLFWQAGNGRKWGRSRQHAAQLCPTAGPAVRTQWSFTNRIAWIIILFSLFICSLTIKSLKSMANIKYIWALQHIQTDEYVPCIPKPN